MSPTSKLLRSSDPATYGKEVTGTVLENVTISYCSRMGGYFRGDGLVICNSLVSDTSREGLYIIGSSDVLRDRNIIRRDNIEQLTDCYSAVVKIFSQFHRVTCRDNLVLVQPCSNGIWYDVGNPDAVFVNNWIEGAQVVFFEISGGPTAAGNVFVRCDRGLRVLNSADARGYNNTFVDAPVTFGRNQMNCGGRPLRLACCYGSGGGPPRGPCVREQPPGGQRGLSQAAFAARATERLSPGVRSSAG